MVKHLPRPQTTTQVWFIHAETSKHTKTDI